MLLFNNNSNNNNNNNNNNSNNNKISLNLFLTAWVHNLIERFTPQFHRISLFGLSCDPMFKVYLPVLIPSLILLFFVPGWRLLL